MWSNAISRSEPMLAMTTAGSLAIATGALLAQEISVSVIANNVANTLTPDFKPQRAGLVSMNPGVRVGAIVSADATGVDLANEFVNLVLAQRAYEASLKAVSASDRMMGELVRTA
jgi:flagellar hook protein FlgE